MSESSSPIEIPALSLVALIGASGAGKSTFARRHFRPTEIVSSDACRGLVSDDENDQAATPDAFALVHFIARRRLARGRLTVIDATSVQVDARRPLVALAREHHCAAIAIVLDLPEEICRERNRARPDRDFGAKVVRQHIHQLHGSLHRLEQEGFREVFVLDSPEAVDAATIAIRPLWCDRRSERGPFDILGDVHGCFDELRALLDRLGYAVRGGGDAGAFTARHPEGRKAVFLGDLVDRGPKTPEVLRLVMAMVAEGSALMVPGNHDIKLLRKLRGSDVQVSHGLAESLEQLGREPPEFSSAVADFLDALGTHHVLDEGKLVVAHAGLKEHLQGRSSRDVRAFALFGETTGETDAAGLPVRYPWARDYRGRATVVYGHTPVAEPEWLNGTVCVDTGCVFGGRLTALRWPEKELVSVPAARVYYEATRPLTPASPSS